MADDLDGIRKGVAMTPPPAALKATIEASIGRAIAGLAPGEGAFVAIATTQGTNFAVVARLPHGFDVRGWFGKTWGEPIDAGVEVRKTFKL